MAEDFRDVAGRSPSYLIVVSKPGGRAIALEAAGWAIFPLIMGGFKIYDKFKKFGLPEVDIIPPEKADGLISSGKLKFEVEGVRNDVLFRRHPYRETIYIQASEYNPYLLREKVSELARVMIAAGATSFDISTDSTTTTQLVAEAAAPLVVEANGSFRVSRRGATKINWSFNGSARQPRSLPENLIWYENQPEWQVVWEAAIYGAAKQQKIRISQETSYEFSADLAAKFHNAGFKLGASFRTVTLSRLNLNVAFSDN